MEGDGGGRVEYVWKLFEVWLHLYSLLVCVKYRSGENNCVWIHTYILDTHLFLQLQKKVDIIITFEYDFF